MRENAADILCIGAQRAMTSWLHRVLTAHPGVAAFPNFDPVTSTDKEAHYWDWNHRRGPDWYRVLMRPLKDGVKTLDFTPEYAFLDVQGIAECKALNPTAKVIYLLRDPLARAVSAVRMRTVWATNNAPAGAVSIPFGPEFLQRCQNARLAEHGAYLANLTRWRAAYPDLLVLSTEALTADPAGSLARILAHLGLPPSDALAARLPEKVWVTPRYALSADCLAFLHGLTWPEREALAQAEGMTFTEGDSLLGGLA
jgi:hypothetical protein